MSNVNLMAREVAAKIVFYGPGLSGKTTTLRKIYESVKPAHRGEMMSLATEGDRTLFFDFLPVKVERVGDCSVRLALYTVPGQVYYNATRKLVLQGADGVVFVADSQPEAKDQNIESLKNLEENLAEQGIKLDSFPLVFQWNKRDLQNVLPVADLTGLLNTRKAPEFETAATAGRGILDALKAITRLVIKDLRSKGVVSSLRPAAMPHPSTDFGATGHVAGLEEQIQQHLNAKPKPSEGGPKLPTAAPAGPEAAVARKTSLGPATALAPHVLVDYARAADAAFAGNDHVGCIRACQEAVRLGLSLAGDEGLAAQGYFLGVNGQDLLKLQSLSRRSLVRVDDAAFALYVLMQVLVRLSSSGLAEPE